MKKKRKYSISKNLVFGFFLFSGTLLMLIGGITIWNSIFAEHIKILEIILGCIFSLFGVKYLKQTFQVQNFKIDNQVLKITSLIGLWKKEVPLVDIRSYMEVRKEDKNKTWKILTIFTQDAKYTLPSYTLSNYNSLKKNLTKGKKENSIEKEIWDYRTKKRDGILILVLGVFLFFSGFNDFLNKDVNITVSQLKRFEGTVAKPLYIKKSGKRSHIHSFDLRITEYPNLYFVLDDIGLQATKSEQLISDFKVGDKIQIEILRDDYRRRLIKDLPLNFWKKHLFRGDIKIYGLSKENCRYFDINQFNRLSKKDKNSSTTRFTLIIGFLMTMFGVYELKINKKPAANNASAFISGKSR